MPSLVLFQRLQTRLESRLFRIPHECRSQRCESGDSILAQLSFLLVLPLAVHPDPERELILRPLLPDIALRRIGVPGKVALFLCQRGSALPVIFPLLHSFEVPSLVLFERPIVPIPRVRHLENDPRRDCLVQVVECHHIRGSPTLARRIDRPSVREEHHFLQHLVLFIRICGVCAVRSAASTRPIVLVIRSLSTESASIAEALPHDWIVFAKCVQHSHQLVVLRADSSSRAPVLRGATASPAAFARTTIATAVAVAIAFASIISTTFVAYFPTRASFSSHGHILRAAALLRGRLA